MANIHPTAVVASTAELADDVDVGPYTCIHDHAQIGAGCTLGAHNVIHSYVRMGTGNQVADHVVLGGAAQDVSYQGQEAWLLIGNDNIFREYSSIHRSNNSEEATRVGNGCYIMCNSHIGHNSMLGNGVIITAFAGLSGHVEVGDNAIIGGHAGVHQFCRIGTYAMVAGAAAVSKDVLPYCLLGRDPVGHYRLNSIGLRRAGVTGDRYRLLEKGIRELRAGNQLIQQTNTPELEILNSWLASASKRGIHKFIR